MRIRDASPGNFNTVAIDFYPIDWLFMCVYHVFTVYSSYLIKCVILFIPIQGPVQTSKQCIHALKQYCVGLPHVKVIETVDQFISSEYLSQCNFGLK